MGVTSRTIEQAKLDLDMIVARNKTVEVENKDLKERVGKLEKQISDLKVVVKQFEPYMDILENPPTRHVLTIMDRGVAMRLAIRTRKIFGRRAARPGMTDDDISKAARVNRDTVATAAIKMGLGPAWERTYREYLISPGASD